MSRIKIETYRGFDIEFDSSVEEFITIPTDENSKSSKSFNACKKYIDDFVKDNNKFAPFYAVHIPGVYASGEKRVEIIGIRKDERFVTINSDGSKGQISDYYLKEYMLENNDNKDLIVAYNSLGKDLDDYRDMIDHEKKELKAQMKIVNLVDYKEELLK